MIVARLMEARLAEGEAHRALLPRDSEPSLRALFQDLPCAFGDYAGRGSVPAMALAVRRAAPPGGLVHAHGPRSALAAAAALRGPVVYTVHGYHGLATPARARRQAFVERLLGRWTAATVWVSEADRATAAAAGIRPRRLARVIENGLALPEAPPAEGRDVDVLFVGRLVEQKWPQAFVQAAAALEGAPNVVMVGAGALAGEVDALVRRLGPPRFRRLDGLPHEAVLALAGRARVLAMTSRWEGLPTVALEAAMSKALVVGFDIPPLAEVLGEAAGALTSPPEPGRLAALISRFLADEPARAAMAERLHDRARARYGVARMAAAYAEVYREAAQASGRVL